MSYLDPSLDRSEVINSNSTQGRGERIKRKKCAFIKALDQIGDTNEEINQCT
jgi:hypothetical protein